MQTSLVAEGCRETSDSLRGQGMEAELLPFLMWKLSSKPHAPSPPHLMAVKYESILMSQITSPRTQLLNPYTARTIGEALLMLVSLNPQLRSSLAPSSSRHI